LYKQSYGVFKKEHLEMLQQTEEDDIIDELDDLDELDNIEKDKDKNEEEILENIVEQEETYIIPRLNIAIKEYDKGNLENICRKLEEYLDSDENRGKSEIVIL
jgi:hypothetical protein